MPYKCRPSRNTRRLPIEPLLAVLPEDNAAAAQSLGISTKSVRDWRSGAYRNVLTERMADRYAVRLGLHPANIWTDW